MKRQNVRTLSLVVCTFTYLLIGAAVFDALESETESKRWEVLSDMRNGLIRRYNITPEDYHMIEIVIIENKPHKAGPQWKFAGAFYFATVVLAMIGYGHSTPVTYGGKAFCMAYAMVGIPLGLVMFQSIGERLNKFASVVIRRAKCYLRCNTTEATEMNLMFATGMLSSIIITTGAAVFSRYEGWSYFDSFYYCFVTLTTIGFGDYVALQNDQALTSKPGYVALSLVFILFGLAVVAASINLLVLRFMTMQAEDAARDEEDKDGSRTLLPIDEHPIMGRQRSHDDQASNYSFGHHGSSSVRKMSGPLEGIHGDTGPTRRGPFESFNLKWGGAPTGDYPRLHYWSTVMDRPRYVRATAWATSSVRAVRCCRLHHVRIACVGACRWHSHQNLLRGLPFKRGTVKF